MVTFWPTTLAHVVSPQMTHDPTSPVGKAVSPLWCCQNEDYCCTTTIPNSCGPSGLGNAFDVILWTNGAAAADTSATASRLYFDFPWHTTRPGRTVYFEVWDGTQWLRVPVVVGGSGNNTGVLRQPGHDENNGRLPHTTKHNYGSPHHHPSNVTSPQRNMTMDRCGKDESEEEGYEETLQLLSPADGGTTTTDVDHDPAVLAYLATLLPAGQSPARFVLLETTTATTTTQSMATQSKPTDIILGMAPCTIHVWSTADRLVIMDVDGSITKSNVMGLVDTLVLESYSHCHEGVCRFLSQVMQKTILPSQGDLRILYLSSRPLSLSNYTRKFLSQVTQPSPTTGATNAEGGIPPSTSSSLPTGPFIGYHGSIADILHMELITHSVHKFKHQCLEENVLTPRLQLGETNPPFWAALGNTWMDVKAYQAAGVPLSRMGFITKSSVIHILRPVVPPSASQSMLPFANLSPTASPSGRYSERSFPSFRDPQLLEYFQQYIEEFSDAT